MKIAQIIHRVHRKIAWYLTAIKLKGSGSGGSVELGYEIIGAQNISIGKNLVAGKNFVLQTWDKYHGDVTGYSPELIIGDNVSFMSQCHISCLNTVVIGQGCLFGDNVFITDNSHGQNLHQELNIPPRDRKLYSKGPVYIGKNVWIGRNVCIMPGVTIGDGAVIGANSVVTHDIPAYNVAAGVPAKVIRTISEENSTH